MRSSNTTKAHDSDKLRGSLLLGPQQIGNVNFFFLLLTVIAQAATIIITWDVWQIRDLTTTVPNLPWLAATPQINFGYLLIASLVFALIRPRRFGLMVHLFILAISIASDQLRCQPQVISIGILMTACVLPKFKRIAVWFLIAMWVWAGIHKTLSPDWYGEVTYYLLLRERFNWENIRLWDYHASLAIIAAVAEVGLGVLAWYRPKLAAPICFLSHIAIAIFLIGIDWNFSVLPWNFCTAIVGAWLLWSVNDIVRPVSLPESKMGKLVVAFLLISPIGFYFGMVRHSLCHVLYSANFPDAVITKADGPMICEAIGELRVPFPHEPKAYIDLFRMIGKPGEKLHIREHRTCLASRYFEMSQQRTVVEISRAQFFEHNEQTVPGIAFDDRRRLFQLEKEFHTANADLEDDHPSLARILKRDPSEMVWAVKFTPSKTQKQSYELIDGLPNLEQIQLSGSNITDDQLRHVSNALRLRGIGLDDTNITDRGLRYLQNLPQLETIQAQRTEISEEAIMRVIGR